MKPIATTATVVRERMLPFSVGVGEWSESSRLIPLRNRSVHFLAVCTLLCSSLKKCRARPQKAAQCRERRCTTALGPQTTARVKDPESERPASSGGPSRSTEARTELPTREPPPPGGPGEPSMCDSVHNSLPLSEPEAAPGPQWQPAPFQSGRRTPRLGGSRATAAATLARLRRSAHCCHGLPPKTSVVPGGPPARATCQPQWRRVPLGWADGRGGGLGGWGGPERAKHMPVYPHSVAGPSPSRPRAGAGPR